MKKVLMLFAVLFVVSLVAVTAMAEGGTYYVCGCGPDCKCGAVSDMPGKCGCGKEMVQMNLLAIDGDDALFCTCGPDCKCTLSADKATCGCGKPVKKVSLSGKYVCGCGPDCKCGMISDKPGKCGCGKGLRLIP